MWSQLTCLSQSLPHHPCTIPANSSRFPIVEYLFLLSFHFFVCACALCADVCVERPERDLWCHFSDAICLLFEAGRVSFWPRAHQVGSYFWPAGICLSASTALGYMYVVSHSTFYLGSGDITWVLMLARTLLTEWFPSPSLQNRLHIWVSRNHLSRINLTTKCPFRHLLQVSIFMLIYSSLWILTFSLIRSHKNDC